MKITLIGRKFITKLILPPIAIGNYWLNGTIAGEEKKLVNIEGQDGKWVIKSSEYLKIIDPKTIKFDKETNKIKRDGSYSKIISKATLENYKQLIIRIGNESEIYVLYCEPVYENEYKLYDMGKDNNIKIGLNPKNDIFYNNEIVSDVHASIIRKEKKLYLINNNTAFGTFINNKPVYETEELLSNGDVIFIMGLRIIVFGNKLYINNPKNLMKTNLKQVKEKTLDHVEGILDGDENVELYSEDEYFSSAPRIINRIEKEKVRIDPPPGAQNREQMPMILTIGSSLIMGISMLFSLYSTIQSKINGTAKLSSIIPSVIVTLLMLVSMIVFPTLMRKYEAKSRLKYEEKRQTKYKKYIENKIQQIEEIMAKQRKILSENYASAEECVKIILSRSPRLWERRIKDEDFLCIRLGTGDVPLDVDIQYPEERFSMEEDNLMDMLTEVGKKSETLKFVPRTISLVENRVLALISIDEKISDNFLQSLILQLMTFHDYQELKMVFFLKKETASRFDYLKILPHVWDNAKTIRFWADSFADREMISNYLEKILKARLETKQEYKDFQSYFLIITDDYKEIERLGIITELLACEKNVGFSVLCITNNIMMLPQECKTFIDIRGASGVVFESENYSKNQKEFTFGAVENIYLNRLCQRIANIPIKYVAESSQNNTNSLPNEYTFLEMYDVGRIEQLNILDRWKRNDSTLSLQAPLGIDTAQRRIVLDIHEKYHGPHGLIAGSTGSGKSELIITYILSLAVNYSPEDVTFILIDYKGGGLAGAFQKRDIKLPHLVGTITNIDTMGLQRSLSSIQSELRKREIIFNEARNIIDEGTIDIYKYQRLYHEGIVKEPIPHLLIICDEFAELKKQEPDFMNELMSVSRIGRSLGVHLILATQKPAGIVNDQIRSNSKFAICLKVQDTSDSNDVLKRPDAAYLPQAGEFYLKVGNNDYFNLGQSALSSTPYYPQDIVKNKTDNSIQFISNIGLVIKRTGDTNNVKVEADGEQLTNIVKLMHELAQSENFKIKKLWLESIPENIYLAELRKKYNVINNEFEVQPVIGEYDDPFNQRQDVVKLDLSGGKNTIIYGNAESGKESLLSTITYDLITNYSSEDIDIYIMDFGSEALKCFSNAVHVGDTLFASDTEKISRLFNMLEDEFNKRKDILSEYNGDYNLYIRTSGKKMPLIIIELNNYEAFSESFNDKYEDKLLVLSREGSKYGIVFVITATASNCMRYRLSQNFSEKIALRLNNDDEYFSIFDKVGKKRPSHLFGRGLVCRGESKEIYEFQSARICDQVDFNVIVRNAIEEVNNNNEIKTKGIPTMPDVVTAEHVGKINNIKKVPVGINKNDLRIATYNFKRKFINIITSKNMEPIRQFLINLSDAIAKNSSEINVEVFDTELNFEPEEMKERFINFVSNFKNNNDTLVMIIGIDKFLQCIDAKTYFDNLKILDKTQKCNIIIADNMGKIKSHEFEEWFKSYNSGDSGIWIGNGIDGQYLINILSNRRDIVNNCGNSYGYTVNQGDATLVKLIGMKEETEDE